MSNRQSVIGNRQSVVGRFLAAAIMMFVALSKPVATGPAIALQLVASSLSGMTDIQHAGDGSGRLFLVQQSGRIRILSGGFVLPTLFLDLSGIVLHSGEQGLLGLAFHPQYAANGVFFVHYTSSSHSDPNAVSQTVIARYHVSSGDPNIADAAGQILLTQDQPYTNHKGGQIRFGPDGFLYIALGDGGSGGDPQNNGQNLNTMLGKILRIDVNNFASTTYAIPPTNPFAASARPEIWAYGLRNPWRFSFDRETGDLFIADVGQGQYEEIDFAPAGDTGGHNYGWRKMEGFHCYESLSSCDFGTLPILEYSHTYGCSVTGGFRYRGSGVPSLAGMYVYGDFCSGRIWGATPDINGRWGANQLIDSTFLITTFGEDQAGELYMADSGGGGRLYRVVSSNSAQSSVTITRIGQGSGRVTSSPAAIDCGATCSATFATGTQVTLSVLPDAGSTFVGWTGDADCADGVVELSADRQCIARFGVAFTDDGATSGVTAGVTAIKAVHITELRSRINTLRFAAGLSTVSWTTDPTLTAGASLPRAAHIVEMRNALAGAYAREGQPAPVFTTPNLAAGDAIRAVFINELRLAVHVLEG